MQVLLLRSRTSNFNSRPHGGRPSQMIRSASYSYFNSRPHGGRRTRLSDCRFQLHISTHALTEGDRRAYHTFRLRGIFQLTPSRRATPLPPGGCPCISRFQLTPSRRATGTDLEGNFEREYFNSRPHGGRRSCAVASRSWIYFNSRPHGGRRILPEGGVT